jgi:hypothetical protein
MDAGALGEEAAHGLLVRLAALHLPPQDLPE